MPRRYHSGELSGVDVSQVCLNGHLITTAAVETPESRKAFCPDCGASTIMACVQCREAIPGTNWDTAAPSPRRPPNYCQACGSAHPWHQSAIANAIEVLEELELEEADLISAKSALPDLMSDTPKSEVAILRIRRILSKAGKPAYDIGIKVISDLASETIKKALLKP